MVNYKDFFYYLFNVKSLDLGIKSLDCTMRIYKCMIFLVPDSLKILEGRKSGLCHGDVTFSSWIVQTSEEKRRQPILLLEDVF